MLGTSLNSRNGTKRGRADEKTQKSTAEREMRAGGEEDEQERG